MTSFKKMVPLTRRFQTVFFWVQCRGHNQIRANFMDRKYALRGGWGVTGIILIPNCCCFNQKIKFTGAAPLWNKAKSRSYESWLARDPSLSLLHVFKSTKKIDSFSNWMFLTSTIPIFWSVCLESEKCSTLFSPQLNWDQSYKTFKYTIGSLTLNFVDLSALISI